MPIYLPSFDVTGTMVHRLLGIGGPCPAAHGKRGDIAVTFVGSSHSLFGTEGTPERYSCRSFLIEPRMERF